MNSHILPNTFTRLFSASLCLAGLGSMLFLFAACGNGAQSGQKKEIDPRQFKKALERVNKYEVSKESDEINQYIARNNWDMKKTGTGLRYIIIEKGKGVQPTSGQFVTVNYAITLLDGTLCYTSEKDGAKEFKAEGDNVESGLHEAVLLMHVGDKAKFILPSYMANGLQGDNDRIPPMSAIVVDLELLSVN